MKQMIQKMREEKDGFTIAELLIVVAIVAVLVAIAIPVFTGALNDAKSGTDQANARSLYGDVQAAYLSAPDKDKFDLTAYGLESGKASKKFTFSDGQPVELNGDNLVTVTIDSDKGVTVKFEDKLTSGKHDGEWGVNVTTPTPTPTPTPSA